MRGIIGGLASATDVLRRAARLERARKRERGEPVTIWDEISLNLDAGPATEEERRRPAHGEAEPDDTDVEEITALQALVARQINPAGLGE